MRKDVVLCQDCAQQRTQRSAQGGTRRSEDSPTLRWRTGRTRSLEGPEGLKERLTGRGCAGLAEYAEA